MLGGVADKGFLSLFTKILGFSALVFLLMFSMKASAAILDDVAATPSAAYGLRKLRSAYAGSAINVRRSSDNTTMDIGFDGNGDLDTTALLNFVGSGSGYVATWYDQTTNNNNAVQSTAANQARIVNAGVIDTNGGKPAILFTSASANTYTISALGTGSNAHTAFFSVSESNSNMVLLGSGASNYIGRVNGSFLTTISNGQGIFPVTYAAGSKVFVSSRDNTSANFYKNNDAITQTGNTLTSANGNFLSLGGFSGFYMQGYFSEFIFYPTALNTADRQRIANSEQAYLGLTVLPSAPTNLVATTSVNSIDLTWTAPSGNGGGVITDYLIEYKLTSSSTWTAFAHTASATAAINVSGLTAGQSYNFRVSGINDAGTGTASSVATGTPVDTFTAPGAPTSVVAFYEDSKAIVTFTPPLSTGGSPITGYTVTSNPGNLTATGSSSPITITGLTNNTAYTFTVTATNNYGTSSVSTASASIMPRTPLISEDFSSGIINSSNWVEADSASGGSGPSTGNVKITGGELVITGNGSIPDSYNTNALATISRIDRSGTDTVLVAKLRFNNCASTAGSIIYGPFSGGSVTNGSIILNLTTGGAGRLFSFPTSVDATGWTCVNNAQNKIRLVIKAAGGVDLYINDAATPNASVTSGNAPASYTNQFISFQNVASNASSSMSVDDIAIYAANSVALPPSKIIITPKNGSLLTQWSQVLNATDYIVEYKPTSGSTWTTVNDGVSANNKGVTITGLTNGVSYDVRVSTVMSFATSAVSSTVTAIPVATPTDTSLHHILSTGQSLSLGFNGTGVLTTVQPYNNKMLTTDFTSLIPLVEPSINAASNSVETMSSALANSLTNFVGSIIPNYSSVVTLHGSSGTAYSGIKKGTSAYTKGMNQLSGAFNASILSDKPYTVSAITAIHGETDEQNSVTASQYEAMLVEWQNDYQTDAKAITGQTGTIPLFIDQMASWTGYSHATPQTAIGQYTAAKNNPSKIYLVTPKYIFDYSDNVHMRNYSYRRLGEYYGKVMKKVLIDGEAWLPLSPKTLTIGGNVIKAKFNVPVTPLVFDTTAVDAKTNYGFEYFDSTSSATITNVAITAPDTVTITLSNTPTGSNKRLRYAYTGTSGSAAGAHVSGAPKGNLRDSDTTPALYQDGSVPAAMGNYLRNWSVTFDEPLVAAGAPSAPATPTASISGTTAMISFTAPADNGSAITNYIVTSSPDGLTASGSSSPVTLSNLRGGVSYAFTVRAVNQIGESAASAASNSVTTASVSSGGGGGGGYSRAVFTPTQTPKTTEPTSLSCTPKGITGTKSVKIGSTSKTDVKGVQIAINQMNILTIPLKEDGLFGTKTYNAIKQAQKKLKLPQDGAWGKNTQAIYLKWIGSECK